MVFLKMSYPHGAEAQMSQYFISLTNTGSFCTLLYWNNWTFF